MAGFLVPIREYSQQTLAAVQFALELHKRTGARQHFLFITSATPVSEVAAPSGNEINSVRKIIEDLLAREILENGKYLKNHHRIGEFFETVRDVVQQKHIDEIIMAVPSESDPRYPKISQDIAVLMQMTHCRVLTIHPKKGS